MANSCRPREGCGLHLSTKIKMQERIELPSP